MNTPNPPASISVSRRLWQSLSISLDQQETEGTADISEEIIHTDRAGVGVAVKCADSLAAQRVLTRALRANPAASHFVFVKRPAPRRKDSATSRNAKV